MSAYRRPVATPARIGDTFTKHVARRSVNAGTDYIVDYGAPVYAVAAGTVAVADGSADGAGGRTVAVDMPNGYGYEVMHLSGVSVRRGQKVAAGALLGHAGGSGFGQNRYYGTHVHLSFRLGHVHYINSHNIDFEVFLRKQLNPDPDPNRQVYYCTGPGWPNGRGWYYLVGYGVSPRTRIIGKRKRWINAFGYGGPRTLAEIQAITASGRS